jgi:hypothetical protein
MAANTHTFTHANKKYTIPDFASLPVGAVRKARKAESEIDQAFTIIEIVMGEDSPELKAIDSMTTAEFQQFLEGWTQGAPLGESSGS